MVSVVTKTISFVSAADTTSTGWIKLNTFQENFNVGYSIEKIGNSDGPVLAVEGTMQDVLVEGSVAAAKIFTLISAAPTSAAGTIYAGQITFPVNAIRLTGPSGASGQSTLTFNILQTGKH